jgi:Malectin domain
MEQLIATHSTDSARAEVEIVLSALARTPRLVHLLKFITDKYFQGKTSEINEYNIAIEVLGRSRHSFDASRDSIARVEAFRLRKRLKEYYEIEGKEHEIHISLPRGAYVPTFSLRTSLIQVAAVHESQLDDDEVEDLSAELVSEVEEKPLSPSPGADGIVPPRLRTFRDRTLLYSIAGIAALLIVGIGAIRFFSRNKPGFQPRTIAAHPLDANKTSPNDAAQVPLRLLAGYNGTPKIDSAGSYWQADRYFHGGAAFLRPDVPVSRTSDPMLFEHWRTGDFTYDIPLAPGSYELHLFFVASSQDDPKTSFFNVSVDGQLLLEAFNIGSDTLGANIADERVFKDIYPDKDGFLHIRFFMDRGAPSLNALEILPGLPHRQLPVRIVMQRATVTDHDGNLWRPDDYFQNGTLSDPPRQVGGTADSNLYAQERYGHFTYSVPVDTRGRYTLILHFAELYWGPQSSRSGGVGSRTFQVFCNGSTLLENFDIFKEVGNLHALTKTFYHLRPSSEGKLDLTFEPIVNGATISAIEVIDESQ